MFFPALTGRIALSSPDQISPGLFFDESLSGFCMEALVRGVRGPGLRAEERGGFAQDHRLRHLPFRYTQSTGQAASNATAAARLAPWHVGPASSGCPTTARPAYRAVHSRSRSTAPCEDLTSHSMPLSCTVAMSVQSSQLNCYSLTAPSVPNRHLTHETHLLARCGHGRRLFPAVHASADASYGHRAASWTGTRSWDK